MQMQKTEMRPICDAYKTEIIMTYSIIEILFSNLIHRCQDSSFAPGCLPPFTDFLNP